MTLQNGRFGGHQLHEGNLDHLNFIGQMSRDNLGKYYYDFDFIWKVYPCLPAGFRLPNGEKGRKMMFVELTQDHQGSI